MGQKFKGPKETLKKECHIYIKKRSMNSTKEKINRSMTTEWWFSQSIKLAMYYDIEEKRTTESKEEKGKFSSGKNWPKNMEKQFYMNREKNPVRLWNNAHPLSTQRNVD